MGSSYGRSSRGIVLRFIVSATGWEAMKWKTMARILPAPAPDSVDLLSGSERPPHSGRIYVATETGKDHSSTAIGTTYWRSGSSKMNDNVSSARSDLQGLRLVRAFLRIRDQRTRSELVEQAERLAAEKPAESGSSLPVSPGFAERPADPLS